MKLKTKLAAFLLAVFSMAAMFAFSAHAADNCIFINQANRQFSSEQPNQELCSCRCAANMAKACSYNGSTIRNPVCRPGVTPGVPTTPAGPTPSGGNNADLAVDGGRFTLSATQMIRYGKDSTWIAKSFNAGTHVCLPSSFDGRDPVPGVQKSCQVAPSGTVATVNANSANLAVDGGNFNLSATQMIRYGKDSTWIAKSFSAGTHVCLPSSFDGRDPVPGVQKSCQVAPSGTAATPVASTTTTQNTTQTNTSTAAGNAAACVIAGAATNGWNCQIGTLEGHFKKITAWGVAICSIGDVRALSSANNTNNCNSFINGTESLVTAASKKATKSVVDAAAAAKTAADAKAGMKDVSNDKFWADWKRYYENCNSGNTDMPRIADYCGFSGTTAAGLTPVSGAGLVGLTAVLKTATAACTGAVCTVNYSGVKLPRTN